MRKLFVAVAALGMLLTSCAKDADVVTGGNESLVSFKVSQPKLGTRAATGSHDATQTYGTGVAAEDLQYAIFEVKGNENQYRFDRDKAGFFEGETLEGTLTERLVNGKTYIAVFWADAAMDKYYTVDWENGTISFVDATKLNAQDENLDAFYGMTAPFKVEGPSTVTAELRRPFAQLNISTCDTSEAAEAGLTVETSYIEVSKVYTAFNFWNGEVDANSEVAVTFAETGIPKTYIYNIDGTAYDVLSMNYLLVNEKKNVDVKFHYASNDQEFESEFTSVPVQRNYRTHIVGNLLTDATDFKIIIKPEFDGEHIYDVYDNILAALKNGGSFTLTSDTTVKVDERIELSEAAVIDLNGYTLTIEATDNADNILVRVNEGGSVIFKDETGKGGIVSNSYIASANAGGVVTVEGGNYKSTNATLFQANGGKVYIKGGHFELDCEEYGTTYMLNHIDKQKENGLIEVTGGQFVDFNPADNKAESPQMNFVAEGHASFIASTDENGVPTYEVILAKEMEGLAVAALGYQNAKLSWTAVANADHYVVKYGEWTSDKIMANADDTTIEYAAMPEGIVTDSRKPIFTVEAHTSTDGMLAVGQTAGDVEIFTLFERPEPEIRLANGQLLMATDVDGDIVNIGNLHVYGPLVAAEVYFYKDGAVTPTYTAKAEAHNGNNGNGKYRYAKNTDGRMKGSNMASKLDHWAWAEGTGAFGAVTGTAPAFAPGTYTIKYVGYYFPVIGGELIIGSSGTYDRITFAKGSGILISATDSATAPEEDMKDAIAREGEVEGSFSIASVEGIAAARNGYKGIEVTWNAVQGATSYEVVADGQKVTVSETKAQFTAADTQHAFTNFSVTALDANGAVVAVGSLAAETQVWTLAGMPEPNITFDGSTLKVTNVLDVMAVCVDITIDFKKDGVVAHTASYNKVSSAYGWNGSEMSHITSGRFTNGMFADFVPSSATSQPNWVWNGAENATAPSFEPGEYTIEYTASYWPIVNGYWADSDKKPTSDPTKYNRVMFGGKDDDVLKHTETDAQMVKTGTAANTYVAGMKFEVSAAIDEGLENIVPGSPFTHSGKYNSINGIYEGAKISWDLNVTYDKVVIAYNGKTVDVTDGSTSKVVTGVTQSPTTFTVTAYNGATQVATTDVTSNIYTLTKNVNPVSFTIKKHADNKHFIFVDGGMTGDAYAFQSLYFNIYEESDTSFANPIFTNDVSKNGDGGLNQTEKAWAAYGNYSYARVDNSDYDTNCTPEYTKEKIAINITGYSKNAEGYFSGLQSGKTYVIKYTLKAYPFILKSVNGNSFVFSSILMNNDVITNHPIVGTYTVTAE